MYSAGTQLLCSVERMIGVNLSSEKMKKSGSYEMIPLDPDEFHNQLELVKAHIGEKFYDKKFIDVGAGAGFRVLQAKNFGIYKSTGIEYNPKYVAVARNLFGLELIYGDAFSHDYGKYDIIYFYCPMRDGKKEVELEKHILETAKKGAIIIAKLAAWIHDKDIYDHNLQKCVAVDRGITKIAGDIFRKN